MPANLFNDGNLVFGSQQVTIGSTVYIADDIEYEVGSRAITRRGSSGIPNAEILVSEVGIGKMTLQVPPTAVIPALGAAFNVHDVDFTTYIPVKLSKIGRAFRSDDLVKIPVEFRQRFTSY